MMASYYVKSPLPGLPAGRVERFEVGRAQVWLLDGAIEAFDPSNPKHAAAAGKPTSVKPLKR